MVPNSNPDPLTPTLCLHVPHPLCTRCSDLEELDVRSLVGPTQFSEVSEWLLRDRTRPHFKTLRMLADGPKEFADFYICKTLAQPGVVPNLEAVDLQCMNLSRGPLAHLAKGLSQGYFPHLVELTLHNTHLEAADMVTLMDALSCPGVGTQLDWLDLGRNQIGRKGLRAVLQAIAAGAGPKLQAVYLTDAEAGGWHREEVQALVDLLTQAPCASRLETLDVRTSLPFRGGFDDDNEDDEEEEEEEEESRGAGESKGGPGKSASELDQVPWMRVVTALAAGCCPKLRKLGLPRVGSSGLRQRMMEEGLPGRKGLKLLDDFGL